MKNECDLCKSTEDLSLYEVSGRDDVSITVCGVCKEQLEDDKKIDESHWYCLNDSMWSEDDAVKVVAFRMLTKLNNQEALDMIYLEDDVRAWAESGIVSEDEDIEVKKDANGNILDNGDTVTVLKDLDVKGSSIVAKRGTVVKNIRLGDVSGHIEGKVNGTAIYLKCEFIKKS